jgi:Domain of unknown function (DUF6894)
MPRFYFHLNSVDRQITDENGKELSTLNDAYDHARKLIDKILCHVGSDDGKAWKVVVLSEEYNVQIIVPFPASHSLFAHSESKVIRQTTSGPLAQAQDILCRTTLTRAS